MNISSINDCDYVKIIATWYYSLEERFNCELQKQKFMQMNDWEKRVEALEQRNGCNAQSSFSGVVEKFNGTPKFVCDDVGFYRCFCNYIDQSTMFLLHLFFQYERGFLPFPGSISEQPSKIIDIFSVFTYLKSERQKELDEKNKKQQQRQMVKHGIK